MKSCQNTNCCLCQNFVSTLSITQVGTFLVLELPATTNLTNNEHLCVAFAQNVPDLIGIPAILISVGGVLHSVIETCHNAPHFMYADQLKQCCNGVANRQILSVIYGGDTGLFKYDGCRRLCKTNAVAENGSSALSVSAADSVSAVTAKKKNGE